MKIAVFSSKSYDRQYLTDQNDAFGHQLEFFEPRLDQSTMQLAAGYPCVCVFVNDTLNAPVLDFLANSGLRVIALRCAGFNQVDLAAAERLKIDVVRVPAYSPHAVAEHTVGLMLCLNRKLHRAYGRVRDALNGLLGFDFFGRCVGIVGTGKIGAVVAKIMLGFGCRLLAHDKFPNDACRQLGVTYVDMDTLLTQSDIVTLHCPLTPQTKHLICAESIAKMKSGVMLINTSRGAIVDTTAVIAALKRGKIGALGIDVYEEEADLFFEDLSGQVMQDDRFARLLTFPNVLVTGHQAFFTADALQQIATTTLANVTALERGETCDNLVRRADVASPPHRPRA